MKKNDIIERLFAEGLISLEEKQILSIQEDLEELKHFGVWKAWRHDESVLLDEKRIEESKLY